MSQARLIRKYVNRRLYDTTESRYVNLEDLRKLIIDGEEIRVTERATGADITAPVLLQIIAESPKDQPPVLEPRLLCEVIRTAAHHPDPGLPAKLTQACLAALREARSQPPPQAYSQGY
ncbi:MAG: hypothetical protein D6727_11645 [Gammaproteobacteria bacterium]|nr:MAG: hypothetical protein D6727_11645 [Gammaproteobacteria bacterium]